MPAAPCLPQVEGQGDNDSKCGEGGLGRGWEDPGPSPGPPPPTLLRKPGRPFDGAVQPLSCV